MHKLDKRVSFVYNIISDAKGGAMEKRVKIIYPDGDKSYDS